MKHLRAYAQLVRLPNVFTALADIALGALVTGALALPGRWLPFGLLLLASACLYSGGMVWNDFFDVEQDRRERPFRPLPSGRIALRSAGLFGAGLLLAGLLCAAVAGLVLSILRTPDSPWPWAPLLLAFLLAGAILLYDGWLKRTWAGPPAMGSCRFLNVLLGLSLAPQAAWGAGVYLALVVGLYITGVTWFARTEAKASSPLALIGAALLMLAAVALALPVPVILAPAGPAPFGLFLFPYLLVAFGLVVGVPLVRAIRRPTPDRVQAAVKRTVLGLVVLDAILATAGAGVLGLLLLVLLVPALYLGRWLYST